MQHSHSSFTFQYFQMKRKELYLPFEVPFIKILWPLYCGKEQYDNEQVRPKLNEERACGRRTEEACRPLKQWTRWGCPHSNVFIFRHVTLKLHLEKTTDIMIQQVRMKLRIGESLTQQKLDLFFPKCFLLFLPVHKFNRFPYSLM